jgi:hypothetical protein
LNCGGDIVPNQLKVEELEQQVETLKMKISTLEKVTYIMIYILKLVTLFYIYFIYTYCSVILVNLLDSDWLKTVPIKG